MPPPLMTAADVSSGTQDLEAFRAAGGEALIIATGDGLGEQFAFPQAGDFARRARAAGLRVGFYHFNRPRRLREGRVAVEAAWMRTLVDRAGGHRPGDARIVIGIESDTGADAVDIREFERQLRNEVRDRFGHEPVLYCNLDFARRHFSGLGRDLWFAWPPPGPVIGSFEQARARWDEMTRVVPSGLNVVGWQFALDVPGPGLSKCDKNLFTPGMFTGRALLAPDPIKEENDMLMFWHGGAIWLDFHGTISPFGLRPDTVEKLQGAGVRIIGRPGDDSEIFRMFAAVPVTDTEAPDGPPPPDYPVDFLERNGWLNDFLRNVPQKPVG